ncbi:MAG: hypothetical protein OXH79_13975 [Boseongicola sp.]|nr:hypothetical protein [Boseongicola sp.]
MEQTPWLLVVQPDLACLNWPPLHLAFPAYWPLGELGQPSRQGAATDVAFQDGAGELPSAHGVAAARLRIVLLTDVLQDFAQPVSFHFDPRSSNQPSKQLRFGTMARASGKMLAGNRRRKPVLRIRLPRGASGSRVAGPFQWHRRIAETLERIHVVPGNALPLTADQGAAASNVSRRRIQNRRFELPVPARVDVLAGRDAVRPPGAVAAVKMPNLLLPRLDVS